MTPLQRHSVLIFAVLGHLIYDRALVPVGERWAETFGEYVGPPMIGTVLGQIAMLAAYLAWGRGHWLVRWRTFGLLATLVWYTVAVGAASTGHSYSVSSIETLLAICGCMLFLLVPIPYWTVRVLVRSQIELVHGTTQATRSERQQFSIRQLLLWTGAAALLLSIGGSAAGREVWSHWPMPTSDFFGILFGMLLLSLLCILMAIPTTCACLCTHSPTRPFVWLGACGMILVAIEWAVVMATTGDNHLAAVVGLNLGIACDVLLCSLLLRCCEYRLTRGHQSPREAFTREVT